MNHLYKLNKSQVKYKFIYSHRYFETWTNTLTLVSFIYGEQPHPQLSVWQLGSAQIYMITRHSKLWPLCKNTDQWAEDWAGGERESRQWETGSRHIYRAKDKLAVKNLYKAEMVENVERISFSVTQLLNIYCIMWCIIYNILVKQKFKFQMNTSFHINIKIL